jgi:predicted acyltransferase
VAATESRPRAAGASGQVEPRTPRLRSLDLFRGATVALMILVNSAGDWGKTWAPLLHAEWHGWTPTDLVFPFFLFIVGAAIPFGVSERGGHAPSPRPTGKAGSASPLRDRERVRSLNGELRSPQGGHAHRRVVRRSALLFLLGLALIWFPFYTVVWERARIFGVLQRIGIVYLFAALAWLHLRPRGRAILATALLGGYWAAMKLVPVPGFGAGDLSPQGNLAFHVDHLLLGPHVWRYSPGPGDPEGILSTFPAIVTALIGLFAGQWLRDRRTAVGAEREAPRSLIAPTLTGAFLLLLGLALAPGFPINKMLWSPTYVLFTGGFAILALLLSHLLVDGKESDNTRWARPFEIFGRQAIVAYVGSGALARILGLVEVGEATLQKWLYVRLFASWLPDYRASFGWALATVLLWLGVAAALDRRGFRLRI